MERGVQTGSVLCIVCVSLRVFLNKTKYWPGLGSPLSEVAAGAQLGVGTGTHTVGVPTVTATGASPGTNPLWEAGCPCPAGACLSRAATKNPKPAFFFLTCKAAGRLGQATALGGSTSPLCAARRRGPALRGSGRGGAHTQRAGRNTPGWGPQRTKSAEERDSLFPNVSLKAETWRLRCLSCSSLLCAWERAEMALIACGKSGKQSAEICVFKTLCLVQYTWRFSFLSDLFACQKCFNNSVQ